MGSSKKNGRYLPRVFILSLALATFATVMGFDFVDVDDRTNLFANPLYRELTWRGIAGVWTEPYFGLYLPVSYSAWALIAGVSHALAPHRELLPALFHGANLLVHALNGVLVYEILILLAAAPTGALLGALFFIVHPLQVETVAWASALRDLLSVTFSLLALLGYLRARPRDYIFATVAFTLAVLAKPSAVAVPGMALVAAWLVDKKSWRLPLLWVALSAPIILINQRAQVGASPEGIALWLRPFLALDALQFYLLKLLSPVDLALDYGRSPERAAQLPGFFWAWAFPSFTLALAITSKRRWAFAGVALFGAALVPVLGLVPFAFQRLSGVADRYAYLSLLGPALIIAKFWTERRPPKWALAMALAGVLVLAALSVEQAQTWRDNRALFTRAVEINPQSAWMQGNLGATLISQGDETNGVQHLERSLALNPASVETYFNLAKVLTERREFDELLRRFPPAAAGESYQEAVRFFHETTARDPSRQTALRSLSFIFQREGLEAEAKVLAEQTN